jgi:hypothetical protein
MSMMMMVMVNILSRVWVAYKTKFGFDDWIYKHFLQSLALTINHSAIAYLPTSQIARTR